MERLHTSFRETKQKSGGLKFYQTFVTPRMYALHRTGGIPTSPVG